VTENTKNSWGGVFAIENHSWEECLPKKDRIGGPSPTGSSYWSDFRNCPYLFYLKHMRRMKITPDHPRFEKLREALELGGLYHEGRARYYMEHLKHVDGHGKKLTKTKQTKIDDKCVNAMFSIVDKAEEIVPNTASQVRRLLEGWLAVAGPGTSRDDRSSTMYIEKLAFAAGDFPFSTRFDRILWSDKLGGPTIQEHKTAGRYSEVLLASYRLDPQILGQIWCWEKSELKKKHGPLKGFCIDLCIKKGVREYPEEWVPIFLPAVKDWARDMTALHSDMLSCLASKRWPRRRGASCTQWMKPCEAHEHCSSLGKTWLGWAKKTKSDW